MPPINTRRGTLGVLSLAHLINDMYSNFLPQLIPFLISARGFTVFAGSTLIAVFTITSSLLQPFFGYLVDQKGQRWLVFVGTVWMGLLLGTTGFIAHYPLLILVSALAGLGTSAFHPQAAAMVGQVSGNRKGFFLAAFIAMGNTGIALCPLIFLPIFEHYGYHATWIAAIPGLLAALLLFCFAPQTSTAARPTQGLSQALKALKKGSADLNKLVLVVALRSLVHTGLMMLLPLYLLNQGYSPESTGYLMFIALGAGSIGGLLGGYLSDRFGRKLLIVGSLFLAAVFLYGFLYVGGLWKFVSLSLGCMALLASFSVTVAAAQDIIPENKALASGLSLGFGIGIGGLVVTPVGKFADIFGVTAAVKLVFIVPLLAALTGMLLNDHSQAEHEIPVHINN